ncbi:MAG: MaoC family dehydratase N-terminal domain-containing protein [Polyangia bacterium]|jgi:acyl dehydratase
METESRYAAFVGRASAPVTYDVERGHIRRFVEAVGDDNPIYVDEAAARAAGFTAIPAPPTFATALRPRDPRDGIEIDWRKLLHGEQEFSFRRPILAGDRVTVVQRIAEATVKHARSGELDLMVLITTGTDARGEELFTARSVVVIRR